MTDTENLKRSIASASEYIDAARVYNRALSAPEVSDLYHATGDNKSRDTRCKAARWETNKSLSAPQIFGTCLVFAPDSAPRANAHI
jgi:hypothetical protein